MPNSKNKKISGMSKAGGDFYAGRSYDEPRESRKQRNYHHDAGYDSDPEGNPPSGIVN